MTEKEIHESVDSLYARYTSHLFSIFPLFVIEKVSHPDAELIREIVSPVISAV
jgi:hypothetical protein